jgi:Flp pilus assembly secretin CpaC
MSLANLKDAMRGAVVAFLLMLVPAVALSAEVGERFRIPVGHAQVVSSLEDVRTVAIAEPDIADAAVGSARTVIVTAKSAGSTNLVIYTEGGRYKIYEIESYVPNQEKQVLLRCVVAEMTAGALHELGLDFWGTGTTDNGAGSLGGGLYTTKVATPMYPLLPELLSPDATQSKPAADGFLGYAKNSGLRLQMEWKALEQSGDIRMLANPSLLARSGEKASFLAGGEFAYQIISGSGSGAAPAIAFKEYGVRVEFTPYVEEDGMIRLKVAPEVSEPDWSRSVFGVPPLNTRKASTTVMLKPGEYLVIGGLKQTTQNKLVRKVPIVGDIPLLGALFTYKRDEISQKELLITVSPELVEASSSVPALPTDQPEKH